MRTTAPEADALAPPPGHPRFAAADGLRAVAITCVIAVHAWAATTAVAGSAPDDGLSNRLLAHLNVGVAIFFGLSGFLLYRPFVAGDFALGPRPAVVSYGWRRALRILPAYWLALAVLALVPGATARAGDGVWALLPLQGLAPAGERSCVQLIASCRLAPLWSLTVELTFYALLPAYAALMRNVPRRRRLVSEGLALGALAALSTALAVLPEFAGSALVNGTVAGHFAPFAFGMFAAVLSAGPSERLSSRAWARAPLFAGVAALLVYLITALTLPPSPFVLTASDRLMAHLAFAAIAALALIPVVVDRPLPHARALLSSRPLRAIGLVSYGLFLWHYTFALAAVDLGIASWPLAFAFVSACSLAPAVASYLLVEKPALRLKSRWLGRAPTAHRRQPQSLTRARPSPPAVALRDN